MRPRSQRPARVLESARENPDQSGSLAELADAVINHAAGPDRIVLLDRTHGRRGQEVLFAQGFRARLIDGLTLSPIGLENEDPLAREQDALLVLPGEREYDAPYDHVAIDNVAAARTASRHLLDLGRYCAASLTTVAPHKQAIARAAVYALLIRLEGGGHGASEPRRVRPGFAPVPGESTLGRP
ncbi:hypothetical protein [Nocardiopsis sp. RV163]|uniref:hypothetical protein n=1 Tax=Nocardiopsis sp. RV163 TaxID=1661388 RepID=UPI000A7EBBD4|nr:hypothetical protein [Nocardiopsis sp. RV163]